MKFLHTADLHLKKEEEKRIKVFQWLINKADEINTDYFIIAGDLFDSDTDAALLRPKLKKLFESARTQFLVIPGNHDAKSFSHDYDYGSNVVQLVKTPFEIIEYKGITICGVPYQDTKFSECIKDLPPEVDILVAHGTLYDESFIYTLLDDEETKYMPIFPANLESRARYVALGHLHSRCIDKKYKKTRVVYSGSPIALDTKCSEERLFSLVTIDKKQFTVDFTAVEDSPYWFSKEFFVFPGNEEQKIRELASFLAGVDETTVMPNVIINGYIAQKDREFQQHIDELEQKFEQKFSDLHIAINVQSWDTIIENRLVQNFIKKTQALDDALRRKIHEIVFPIFSDALK